jgi:hypothetical protein
MRKLELDTRCVGTVPKLLEVSTDCRVACHLHFQAGVQADKAE